MAARRVEFLLDAFYQGLSRAAQIVVEFLLLCGDPKDLGKIRAILV